MSDEKTARPAGDEVLRGVAAQVFIARECLACGRTQDAAVVLRDLQSVLPAPEPRNLLAARTDRERGIP